MQFIRIVNVVFRLQDLRSFAVEDTNLVIDIGSQSPLLYEYKSRETAQKVENLLIAALRGFGAEIHEVVAANPPQ